MDLTQSEVTGCPTSGLEPDLAWETSRPGLGEIRGLASTRHAWLHLEGRVKLVVREPGVLWVARDFCVPGFLFTEWEPRVELSTSPSVRWDVLRLAAHISQKRWEPSCVFLVTHWFFSLSQHDCLEVQTVLSVPRGLTTQPGWSNSKMGPGMVGDKEE